MTAATYVELDESALVQDGGDVYLFQWLSSAERTLKAASSDEVKRCQNQFESALIKIILASDPFPPPGRPTRASVSRCLILVYTHGETKSLYDTTQIFLKLAGDVKVTDKDLHKSAALYCIGELMATFGSQVMSLMAEICTVTMKLYKGNHSVLLRHHALIALRKSLTTARRAVTPQIAKDVLKQMRSALSDRALAVQRAACEVLIAMYPSGDVSITAADVESVVALCIKSLDGADQTTRRSLSRLAGHILALSQQHLPPPPPEPGKKTKDPKNSDDQEDNDPAGLNKTSQESPKTVFTVEDMFLQLSSGFNKPNASRKVRVGIIDIYSALLATLGVGFVERNYTVIVHHFLMDVVSNPRNYASRYDTLLVRKLVTVLLRDLIGVRMLGEQTQIGAIQDLSSSYLKKWPALMPGQVAPTSLVLSTVLKEIAGLLQQLGNAPPPVQDALMEPLLTLLGHPNHTTRTHAAWALKCFCYAAPLRLPKLLLSVMELLQRDITSLSTPAGPLEVGPRALGHAYGLAALVSVIPDRPLYVSFDTSVQVLDMATQLLKRAAEHDVKAAGTEIEVAWTMIAALMALGPNFVRAHLSQLLVLWRNALPKSIKDTVSGGGRSIAEWLFLLHVRESALGAMLNFLRYNSSLVTLDVARRISSLLANALSFANAFISQSVDDPPELSDIHAMNIRTREMLLRRRIYQCFTALGFSTITESTQSALLQSSITLFASPEGYAGSAVQAAIASSSGSFTTVWQTTDAYAYGLLGLQVDDDLADSWAGETSKSKAAYNRDTIESSVDDLLRTPILRSCEHDPLSLCQTGGQGAPHILEAVPPATSVVDAAVELFAHLLHSQETGSVVRVLNQVMDFVRSPKLEKNAGRRSAVTVNVCMALLYTLRQAAAATGRQAGETLGSPQVSSIISPFLKDCITDGDAVLRSAAGESIGRLCNIGGTNYLTAQMKVLVDQVVNNRDPHGRAGCSSTFGAIYAHVGGLAAGPLLKTAVNVLVSLANDPHPVVHFWAIRALAQVADAASLTYAPFVTSTLGMLLKTYTLESHEAEGGSLSNSNISGDLPTAQAACLLIDAIINVLGPDMMDSARTRTLLLDMVHEYSVEEDEGVRVEAIRCIQHFLMFAQDQVHVEGLITQLTSHLTSSRRPLKLAAINALYQLVQTDALTISKIGGDGLVEQLFAMLDDDPSIEGVRNVILSWLQQTVIYNPSAWIDLCQRIMSRTTASQRIVDAASKQGGLQDDEGESFNVGATSENVQGMLTSRWRTQLFALQCLHRTCAVVHSSGRREHLDIPFARKQGLPTAGLLVSRVPDLIKMAFTASAAHVTEIRLEGLNVLRTVIEVFSTSPDPDYEDALLLEQHQAPITAALTPAFSSDSTPEILAAAVKACAVFVGSGVVRDVSRMGRILRLLTSALEQSKTGGTLSLGDAIELGPNASVMLRISTLSAWAELAVAATSRTYLQALLTPYRATLASLWIASLRDYASIRADSEVMQDTTAVATDATNLSLGKDILLPYYSKSSFMILHAVGTAMSVKDPWILASMDGQDVVDGDSLPSNPAPEREEQVGLFYVIFGLCYEVLASSSTESTSAASSQHRQASIVALRVLRCLVQPEYAGKSFHGSPAFHELVGLCSRIAVTEPASVQIPLVEMVAALATTCTGPLDSSQGIPSGAPQTHCLRLCAYVLRNALPGTKHIAPHTDTKTSDRIILINIGFDSFSKIGRTLGVEHQHELRSIAISLYSDLLSCEAPDVDIAGATLQSLKSLLDVTAATAETEHYHRLAHAILSACLINIDGMRGRQGPMATKKIQNNLLAAVLILTVVPKSVRLGQPAIDHCCFLISQKLVDGDDTSLTAAHCAKTLVVASVGGNPSLRYCTKLLLPGMIEFIVRVASAGDDDAGERYLPAVAEIWKAFTAFISSVPQQHGASALGIVLPTMALLLDPARSPAQPMHKLSVSQVLSLATSDPSAFKEATAKLDQKTKDVLETSIRQALGGSSSTGGQQAAKPQISLKAFK